MKTTKPLLMTFLLLSLSTLSSQSLARGGGHGGHSSSHGSSHSGGHSSIRSGSRYSHISMRYKSRGFHPYYYHYGMYHPFGGYHHYSSGNNTIPYQELSLRDWIKTTEMTKLYLNKFSNIEEYEYKAVLNCKGSMYGCKNNTNPVSHDYDVALTAGFKDATKNRLINYGIPDLNNSTYHMLRNSYHKNKYRVDGLETNMFFNRERANTIKTAYFFGYAAGLYTLENNIN